MPRVITVTSGKGGVGKTNISVNLGVALAGRGHRTCIFDADLGLANINILLGIRPEFDLADVLSGEKRLSDIILQDPSGIDIVPGGTGIERLTTLSTDHLRGMITAFAGLGTYDALIFDTSAGISRDVLAFCMASGEVLLVLVPEPTSLTDGYSLLKVLSHNGYQEAIRVVINRAKNERYARVVFDKFKETVGKFLPLDLHYLGSLPADEEVAEAVARQRPFVTLYPDGRTAVAVDRLAQNLLDTPDADRKEGNLNAFWDKFSALISGSLQLPAKAPAKAPAPAPTPPIPAEKKTTGTAPEAVLAGLSSVSQQMLQALNQLVAATTDISRELKEFRHALGTSLAGRTSETHLLEGPAEAQLPPLIPLDFAAYVAHKRKTTQSDALP